MNRRNFLKAAVGLTIAAMTTIPVIQHRDLPYDQKVFKEGFINVKGSGRQDGSSWEHAWSWNRIVETSKRAPVYVTFCIIDLTAGGYEKT